VAVTGSVQSGRDTVEIHRSALQGSHRVIQENTPLIRGEITESPDEALIEVPLPVALGEDAEPVRVLHVDDDPEIGEVTAMWLERINDNITVLSETTVVAALNRLDEADIDCVVSDYEMPNTNGLEFLEIVRERYPDLPFILFTGKGSEQIASEAIARDVTDYMQKGVRTDQYEVLANRVENAVEQYRTQQQFWNALSWYQRLVEQELAGVFIVQDGEFVYVNEKLAEIFGYGQRELVGDSPLDVATAADADRVRRELVEHDAGESDTFQYSFTGTRADGSTVDVAVHGGAIEYDGDPACIGILRHADEDRYPDA
jgi:PAS domain S-box-containing protein